MGRESPRMKSGHKTMNFLLDWNCHVMGKEQTEEAENSTHLPSSEGQWEHAGMQSSGYPS